MIHRSFELPDHNKWLITKKGYEDINYNINHRKQQSQGNSQSVRTCWDQSNWTFPAFFLHYPKLHSVFNRHNHNPKISLSLVHFYTFFHAFSFAYLLFVCLLREFSILIFLCLSVVRLSLFVYLSFGSLSLLSLSSYLCLLVCLLIDSDLAFYLGLCVCLSVEILSLWIYLCLFVCLLIDLASQSILYICLLLHLVSGCGPTSLLTNCHPVQSNSFPVKFPVESQ